MTDHNKKQTVINLCQMAEQKLFYGHLYAGNMQRISNELQKSSYIL